MNAFNTPEHVSMLQASSCRFKNVGVASSFFQDQPYESDRQTDWGYELKRSLYGQSKRFRGLDTVRTMPHFFRDRDWYSETSAALGLNMFRLSLDFGRLCPGINTFDHRLMKQFMRFLVRLKALRIEPMITLNHYTMPLWLCEVNRHGEIDRGAWEHAQVISVWENYVHKVVTYLSSPGRILHACADENISPDVAERIIHEGLVSHIMTFNEPIMVPLQGYIGGAWLPYKRVRPLRAWRVMKTMIEAHHMARDMIDTGNFMYNRVHVGVGYNWQYWDGPFGDLVHWFMNEKFYSEQFEKYWHSSDFLGLHYYFRQTAGIHSREGRVYSDHPGFGDIYPEGILPVLRKMNKAYPGKDIFISEIGFSDGGAIAGIPRDQRRPHWIMETVKNVFAALAEGIPIQGVLLWTLVNSLEWDYGMTQEFGLFNQDDIARGALWQAEDKISSHRVWQAVAEAVRNPTEQSLGNLDRLAAKAYIMYCQAQNARAKK